MKLCEIPPQYRNLIEEMEWLATTHKKTFNREVVDKCPVPVFVDNEILEEVSNRFIALSDRPELFLKSRYKDLESQSHEICSKSRNG